MTDNQRLEQVLDKCDLTEDEKNCLIWNFTQNRGEIVGESLRKILSKLYEVKQYD